MTSSWMLVAGALFATMGVCAKFLAGRFTGAELSFYRSLIGLIAVGAFALWTRRSVRTSFLFGHFWRGLAGTISLVSYFYALTQLPLATAITLNYTSPLWLTVLSTVLLKERFSPRLLGAMAVGFVGAALVLHPTLDTEHATAGWIGLGSGFFAACAYVGVKKLGDAGEPEWRVVFYFCVIGALGSALTQGVATGTFHAIQGRDVGLLLGVGLAATLAQLAMTRAYHSGNTLVAGAFAYSTVVYTAVAGIVFFEEFLSASAWVGIALIVASGLLAKLFAKPATRPGLPEEED